MPGIIHILRQDDTASSSRLRGDSFFSSRLVLSIVLLAVSLSSCTRSALTKEESLFAKFSKSFVAAFRPGVERGGGGREGGVARKKGGEGR